MADDPKLGTAPEVGEDQIRAVLTKMGIGTGQPEKPGTPAGPPGDLGSQVAEAVRVVREGDAAAREREKTEARLAALEAAKKTPDPEKQPAEHRWITKFMGWVDDER